MECDGFSFFAVTFYSDSLVFDPSIYCLHNGPPRSSTLLLPLPKQTVYYSHIIDNGVTPNLSKSISSNLDTKVTTDLSKSISSSLDPGVTIDLVKNKASAFRSVENLEFRCIQNYCDKNIFLEDICIQNCYDKNKFLEDICIQNCYDINILKKCDNHFDAISTMEKNVKIYKEMHR